MANQHESISSRIRCCALRMQLAYPHLAARMSHGAVLHGRTASNCLSCTPSTCKAAGQLATNTMYPSFAAALIALHHSTQYNMQQDTMERSMI